MFHAIGAGDTTIPTDTRHPPVQFAMGDNGPALMRVLALTMTICGDGNDATPTVGDDDVVNVLEHQWVRDVAAWTSSCTASHTRRLIWRWCPLLWNASVSRRRMKRGRRVVVVVIIVVLTRVGVRRGGIFAETQVFKAPQYNLSQQYSNSKCSRQQTHKTSVSAGANVPVACWRCRSPVSTPSDFAANRYVTRPRQ